MEIGKFTILGELGTGAGSRIYKVRREADSLTYALKIVAIESNEDRKYVEQVQNEFDVTRGFDHPNLLKVHALEIQKKLFFVSGARLLLEYVDGMALADCPGLPLVKLVSIFFKVANGMAAMHADGIYHADIKPDNILVGRRKEVKVIDFGLAWRRGEKKDRVQGTLEFLAPEQAQNKVVNGKTDIFNLGATMYRTFLRSGGSSRASSVRRRRTGDIRQLRSAIDPRGGGVPGGSRRADSSMHSLQSRATTDDDAGGTRPPAGDRPAREEILERFGR